MPEWIKVIILGVIEGITEFLPVSSTGHLIVASSALELQAGLRTTFEIFIQIGAVVAVIVIYRHELLRQARIVRYDQGTRRLWKNLLIAFVPLALIGFVLRDWIQAVLFTPWVVGLSLIVGGVILILVEQLWVKRQRVTTTTIESITQRQAIMIGALQTLALIPGISRSAASIMGGMLSGIDRRAATEFSFLLAIPILGGATIGELIIRSEDINRSEMGYLLLGALVSGLVAWVAVKWLLRYVARHNFVAFGVYRILAGLLTLALIALGIIPATF